MTGRVAAPAASETSAVDAILRTIAGSRTDGALSIAASAADGALRQIPVPPEHRQAVGYAVLLLGLTLGGLPEHVAPYNALGFLAERLLSDGA